MPELPEVETIKNQLDGAITGKVVKDIVVLRAKSFVGDDNQIIGQRVVKVERKAKVLSIEFQNNVLIQIHLKMTGQLIFVDKDQRIVGGHPTPDWVNELPSKHTRVIITFEDGARLYFNDMRVFGWVKVVSKKDYETSIRDQAPDVTDASFTKDFFFDLLKKTNKPIKLLLLDQDKIGGLGNIYVNDALFLAKILPMRKANSLSRHESNMLWESSIEVINRGIKFGGASASNYVQLTGLGGTYQDHFLIYKRDGSPCLKCGTTIEKLKIGGRGTFYCPNCQK